jgi:hypothetical protein
MLVSTKAATLKASTAKSARCEKVAIGIHYLIVIGAKVRVVAGEFRWAHNA